MWESRKARRDWLSPPNQRHPLFNRRLCLPLRPSPSLPFTAVVTRAPLKGPSDEPERRLAKAEPAVLRARVAGPPRMINKKDRSAALFRGRSGTLRSTHQKPDPVLFGDQGSLYVAVTVRPTGMVEQALLVNGERDATPTQGLAGSSLEKCLCGESKENEVPALPTCRRQGSFEPNCASLAYDFTK